MRSVNVGGTASSNRVSSPSDTQEPAEEMMPEGSSASSESAMSASGRPVQMNVRCPRSRSSWKARATPSDGRAFATVSSTLTPGLW